MGRFIYEHYTGESVWKYMFGRQPSELRRIKELLSDVDYEVLAHMDGADDDETFESIEQVPEDYEIYTDSVVLNFEEIDELREIVNGFGMKELHAGYARLLHQSPSVTVYRKNNEGNFKIQEALTEDEFVEYFQNNHTTISYGYNDTDEMKAYVEENDYDFKAMVEAIVIHAENKENREVAIEAAGSEEDAYFLFEGDIN